MERPKISLMNYDGALMNSAKWWYMMRWANEHKQW